MIVALFLALIVGTIIAGTFISARIARAGRLIYRLQRDDAICREVERAERDVYARWWLV